MANHTLPSSGLVDRSEYPFRSQMLELGPGKMHYVDQGSGEPLVFIHGTPTWSFEWRHLIRAFAPSYRCIAPDLLGFGLSERPAGFPYTPEAHAKALAECIEKLNPQPFTLVVHDYGGPIGLPLAFSHPTLVKRVVVINTWMWSFAGDLDMEQKGRIGASALAKFLYRHANLSLRVIMPQAYGDRRKLTAAIHRQYLERFPDPWSRETVLWRLAHALLGSSAFYDSLWQQRALLQEKPALIVWGLKDSAFLPHQLERWKETLPHAQVTVLEQAGHWPHEEEPERVIAALRAFLEGGAAERRAA